MSSRARRSKTSTGSYSKNRTPKVDMNVTRDPLWEFTEVNDAASVICEVVSEQVLINCNVNLLSLKDLGDSMASDLNKSDVVLVISAAVLIRIGMTSEADALLATSDVVTESFKSMGLENKGILKLFTNMVCILNPEFMKSVEFATAEALRKRSMKTAVTHTSSRMHTAMNGLVASGSLTTDDSKVAALNSSVPASNDDIIQGMNRLLLDAAPRNSYTVEEMKSGKHDYSTDTLAKFTDAIVSKKKLIDFVPARDNDEIRPSDSASNKSMSPDSKMLTKLVTSKASFDEKQDDMYYEFPYSKRPTSLKQKRTKSGIGFESALDEIPRENMELKMNRLRRMSEEKRLETNSLSGPQAAQVEEEVSDGSSIL